MPEQEIMGLQEIAAFTKVTPAAVANWRTRFKDFPKPIADLAAGPVFRRDQIINWLKRKRKRMAIVFSMINLKGGVAKTTTTVALAQMLDSEFARKVLVIDLDPQTNATVMLIGDKKWKDLNQKHHTIAQLFEDAIKGENKFDFDATLQKSVGSVSDSRRVDLLPSSLDLIDIQDRLSQMSSGKFHALTPIQVLGRALRPILENDHYDFVLIDCPPSLGLVTLNGLHLSDYYIIPTIPDFLSTYGIPQIVQRVKEFSDAAGLAVEPLGILATKYREQSPVHRQQLNILKQGKDAPVLNTVVPENSEIAGAAEYRQVSTLRQKWGYRGQFDIYRSLAKEILDSVEAPVAV